MSGITPRDVEALSRAMTQGGVAHLRLTVGAETIELGDAPRTVSITPAATEAPRPLAAPAAAAPTAANVVPDASPAAGPAPEGDRRPAGETGHVVRAPNLGTFYRSPTPGVPAYVEVGQRVSAGDEVCLIEVMKLYTPVVVPVDGVVREILVEDSVMVEFDQELLIIEPDAAR